MVFKTCGVALAAALLAACGAPKTREPIQGGAGAPPPPQAPNGAATWRIDSANSEIKLLVYRAGPLARLGHDHVIVNRAVSGWVDATGPRFALRVPVTEFSVDGAAARSEEGPDFSAPVTEDAISGTRRNMLSAAVLDADRFPAVTLDGVAAPPAGGAGATPVAPAGPAAVNRRVATVSVGVAGHQSTVSIPFTLEASAGRMAASGTAVLRQTDLGLTPFSALLGALQVQDAITVKFRLVMLGSPGSLGSPGP